MAHDLQADPNPMLRADLEARCEQHALMLQVAQPELETLALLAASARSIVLLADATGVILQEAGSTDFLHKAERVALRPGVSWAEPLRGTNAIGTALIDAAAVRVHGTEHFLQCNRILSCHAAPVRSPRGDTIGVVDISAEATTFHDYALGLAQICARQISNRLLEHTDSRLHRLVFQHRPSLMDSSERAILLVEDNRIVGANEAALFLLKTDWSVLDSPVGAWIDDWTNLRDTPQAMRTTAGVPLTGMLRIGKSPAAQGRSALPAATAADASLTDAKPPPTRHHKPALPSLDKRLTHSLHLATNALNAGMSILLQGETGAGKEVFAKHLHMKSDWQRGPFVAVNCGALPESLIESELFGYEAGAFTGARREGADGRLREAHGGILFLDEIGDMPLMLQTRLLRALQEREVQPLGSSKRIPVHFGVISATNRKLSTMVENGAFRADLYYRLQDYNTTLPALREHPGLRQLLCQEFKQLGSIERAMTLADSALDSLARYGWPGNYREMQSILRRLLFLHPAGSLIQAEDLPVEIIEWQAAAANTPASTTQPPHDNTASGLQTYPDARPGQIGAQAVNTAISGHCASRCAASATLRDINDQTIQRAIAESHHNISQAARALGVHRSTLYRYLARIGNSAPEAS